MTRCQHCQQPIYVQILGDCCFVCHIKKQREVSRRMMELDELEQLYARPSAEHGR